MLLHRFALPLILASLLATPAFAGGSIEIMHPSARPTIPNRPGVAYFGVHNHGEAADRLIGAHAEGVEKTEIHESRMLGEVMTMAPVDFVEIPANGMADFGPGGLHLMLFGINPPLRNGDSFELILIFEHAGEVPVTVPVTRKAGQMMHEGEGHQHQYGSGAQMQGGEGQQHKHQHGTTGN
jgi:copper(I)-binding protein